MLTACFDIDKFGDHEISLFERPARPARNYASKKPTDMVHVARVLKWDRGLHCLFMDRDPRDVVVSQHGSRPGEYWCDYPIWARNQCLVAGLRGHPRVHVCRYEDLVRDPDRAQAAIAAAFPFLLQRHAFSEFEKVSQSSDAAQLALKGVRAISDKSVGAWRQDLPRVAAQLRDHPNMAQGVVEAGYAEDASWVAAVEGVVPSEATSVRVSDGRLHGPMHGKGPLARRVARIRRRLGTLAQEGRYVLGALLG